MARAAWLGLLILAVSSAASAAPILYSFTGGSASVTLLNGSTPIATASRPLDGISVEFDAAGPALTDFSLLLDDSISFGPILGYHTLAFTISAAPGAGYASSGTGTNPYDVTSGPIDVVFSGSLIDGILPPIPVSGSETIPSLGASIVVTGSDIHVVFSNEQMMHCYLGTNTLTLLVQVEFFGTAVPEPRLGLLLALGALALPVSRRLRST
jgi:hypothetical protein